jgi:transposase-like protein
MSLLDFQRQFPDEGKCHEYMAKIRFPGGLACPRCNSRSVTLNARRSLWQCRTCRRQFSVTAGTMFHRTRTPLLVWFWTIFLVAIDKRGHSALQLHRELSVPYDRAWRMLHKIRAAMAYRDKQYALDGIVELDEAYFGAPDEGRRGRATRRAKAFVALGLTPDGKPRFLKIQTAKRLDARSVKTFVTAGIVPRTTIRTDGLSIYSDLRKLSFLHEPTVAPGKSEGEVLYWTHTVISNAKAFILGTFHGLGEMHIQRYLDEFSYRFNRRRHETEMFGRLLLACASAPPATLAELIL